MKNLLTTYLKYLSIFFISISISLTAYSSSYIDGRGHFFAKSSDKMKFVKAQLLSSAFKDVITKELKNMWLNPRHFCQQFDAKFEEYFSPIKASLKIKYKIDDPATKVKVKNKFAEDMRSRRLRTKTKFGKISRVIQSYSIKNISRSTKMPNSRYMNMSAKVNKKLLRNIYFKFTSEGEARHFKTLYVSSDFQIEDMTWLDAGVEVENDFTKVIKEHWKKWFLENLNSYVDNVVIADIAMSEKINAYFKLSERSLVGKTGQDETRISISDQDEFSDSLWLKLSSIIKKLEDNEIMNTREFDVAGDFILIDLKTNKLIKHFDFTDEKKVLSVENTHDLSSSLASTVYRMPIVEFQEIPKSLSALPSGQVKVGLQITNVKNILDLFKIKDLLAEKGIAYRLESEINSYTGKVGKLLLSYQGNNDNIIQTLKSLNNQEIEPGRIIKIDSAVNPFSLIIHDHEKVEKNETSS